MFRKRGQRCVCVRLVFAKRSGDESGSQEGASLRKEGREAGKSSSRAHVSLSLQCSVLILDAERAVLTPIDVRDTRSVLIPVLDAERAVLAPIDVRDVLPSTIDVTDTRTRSVLNLDAARLSVLCWRPSTSETCCHQPSACQTRFVLIPVLVAERAVLTPIDVRDVLPSTIDVSDDLSANQSPQR
eukprot:1581426-Rhodomonas_salina.1